MIPYFPKLFKKIKQKHTFLESMLSRDSQNISDPKDHNFIKPYSYRNNKDYHIAWVNTEKFDNLWKNNEMYVTSENAIYDRYEKFKDYWLNNKDIEVGIAFIGLSPDTNEEIVSIGNGRHRYAFMKDIGMKSIPMLLDSGSLQYAKENGFIANALIEAIQKGYEILFEAVGRNIMYHGTHKRNLQSILKQGLIPNPKQREWKEDPDIGPSRTSRQSYEGIYLAENLMTATGSAGRRTDNSNKEKERIVVVVDIEKATAIPDEDDLSGISSGLSKFFGKKWNATNMALQVYIDIMKDKGNLNLTKNAINALKIWERGYTDDGNPIHKEYLKAKIPYVVDTMKKYITRQAAWEIESTTYKQEKFIRLKESNVPPPPDVKQAEIDFRNSMDTLMRKLKASFKNSVNVTARMLEPITYSGSNKIIAVLGIVDNYGNEDYVSGKTPYQTVKEYYGSVTDPRFADDFKEQMKRFGDWDIAKN